MTIEIFFSYAREDEGLRDQLESHLASLKRGGVVSGWHDRQIVPGSDWNKEIDDHLSSAQVILFLVSADFINSDYCWGVEIKRAMTRHRQGDAIVIPVILRPTDWKNTPFGRLQALPSDSKPVSTWANRDSAFLDIVQGIRRALAKVPAASAAAASDDAANSAAVVAATPQGMRSRVGALPPLAKAIMIVALLAVFGGALVGIFNNLLPGGLALLGGPADTPTVPPVTVTVTATVSPTVTPTLTSTSSPTATQPTPTQIADLLDYNPDGFCDLGTEPPCYFFPSEGQSWPIVAEKSAFQNVCRWPDIANLNRKPDGTYRTIGHLLMQAGIIIPQPELAGEYAPLIRFASGQKEIMESCPTDGSRITLPCRYTVQEDDGATGFLYEPLAFKFYGAYIKGDLGLDEHIKNVNLVDGCSGNSLRLLTGVEVVIPVAP